MYERRTKRRFDTSNTSTAPPPPPVHDQHPWPREREDEPIPLFATSPTLALQPRTWNVETVRSRTSGTTTTQFVDPDVIRLMGIRSDLEDMFVELGMGHMATNSHVLYPELVRQFMATVQVYDANERAKRASEGILTFFICDIRYIVPLSALSTIYCIQFCPNPNLLRAPSTMPRYYTMQRLGGPQQGQSAAAFPPFPPMLDMSTRPEGDFQRVVVDALTDIWARVSRCRCLRRRSV
ncbi:hypothetical protein F2Q68_00015934 [Brassica cretica]|uniref:Arabidopsis retrotransposon Orf1 C-terminal domain-containing protein n=1 Tax=Brassica cretica TaxID=69181 RepID=A0A8S9HHU7_BRACR|nr:hypothetical protein F2Q68_00015934 [Brassica cretica]